MNYTSFIEWIQSKDLNVLLEISKYMAIIIVLQIHTDE